VEVNYGEKIYFTNDYPITTNEKNIKRLKIRLLDEFNLPVQTRSNYVMKLQFIADTKE
jgi:hypothetical protein